MQTVYNNTHNTCKNEPKHSEMGPVRQNPIQRTVSLFICVCIALCTIVAHNIAQNRPDSFPPYLPDDHHSSDDVYIWGKGGFCDRKSRVLKYFKWNISICFFCFLFFNISTPIKTYYLFFINYCCVMQLFLAIYVKYVNIAQYLWLLVRCWLGYHHTTTNNKNLLPHAVNCGRFCFFGDVNVCFWATVR